jgi:hypothetical protein
MPVPAWPTVGALFLLAAGPLALAQDAAPAAEAPQEIATVSVSELKDPLSMRASAVVRAHEAFNRHQHLAPGATLQFQLVPRGKLDDRPLVLKIEAENGDDAPVAPTVVPIGPDLIFQLPALSPAQAKSSRLILNRKKGQMEWWPHIRGPQASEQSVRLGNLKLECEVFWAAGKTEMPLVMRGMLSMVDLCNSPRVMVFAPAPRRLRAATVTVDGKTWPLWLGEGGWSYRVPLTEAKLNNDSLIEFSFAEDQGEPPKHRVSLSLGMSKVPSQLKDAPAPAKASAP